MLIKGKKIHKPLREVQSAAIPVHKRKPPFLVFPIQCRIPWLSKLAGISPMNQRSLTQLRVVSGNLKTGRPFADSAVIGAGCDEAVGTADGSRSSALLPPPRATSCPELPAVLKQEVMSHTGTLQEATEFFSS